MEAEIDIADRIVHLLNLQLTGQLSTEEGEELRQFFLQKAGNENINQEIDSVLAIDYLAVISHFDTEKGWEIVKKRIYPTIYSLESRGRSVPAFLKVAVAIVVVFAIGILGYWMAQRKPDKVVGNLAPLPKDKAVLVIGNGSQVNLDSLPLGASISQSGSQVVKKAAHELMYYSAIPASENDSNTLSVPYGNTYKVQLPDGSEVWVNAGSTITYPTRFADTNRRVTLSGEAYFSVKETRQHDPFRVKANGVEVTVLGTRFNVNAYDNEPTVRTSLLQGELKIRSGEKTIDLHTGQEAGVMKTNDSISIGPITKGVTGWFEGLIEYSGPIEGLMRLVDRHFRVTTVFENVSPASRKAIFTLSIPTDMPLKTYIKVLNATFNQRSHGSMRVRLKADTLIVSPDKGTQ